jgi:site-specific DNA recombinase
LVKGIHKPIISEETFYAVQDILDGKKAKLNLAHSHGKKTELPLRGFLECPRCGRILTGSASKGNGGRYFYYHCSRGCGERFRANIANDKFVDLLREFKPREDMRDLYKTILDELLQEFKTDGKGNLKNIDAEINKIKVRIENLQDKFADNFIEAGDYNSTRQRYESQLRSLNEKKQDLAYNNKDVQEQLVFSYNFLESLPSIYLDSAPDVKQQIIGSIFPEKFSFFKNQYRTKRVNAVAELIRTNNEPFGRNKKGQFSKKTKLSYQVAGIGL